MRHKGLILLFLAFFILGGLLSYQVLTSNATEMTPEYIHIDNIGMAAPAEDIEIPHTGGEVIPMSQVLAIMQPGEVVALEPNIEPRESQPEEETPLDEPILPGEGIDEDNQQVIDQDLNINVDDDIDAVEASDVPQDLKEGDTNQEVNAGYVVWLIFSGIIVAGLGVYLLEQHFMR